MILANEKFRADDRTFFCTRKAGYPIKSMAERVANELSRELPHKVTVYQCSYCDKFHIGHDPGKREEKMEYKFFVQESGVLLAKIKLPDSQWVFMLPPDMPENEYSVIENGILVAYKEGADYFREKDTVKSPRWQLFNHILPIYPRDVDKIRDRIVKHLDNIEHYDKALMDILNNVNKKHEPRKILVRPEEQKVKEQEMYQGRAVFRTPDGKPFYRDVVVCASENCRNEIELRAYISQNEQGELTYINKRTPLDGKAMIKPGPGNRGAYPKWLCKNCVHDQKLNKKQCLTEQVVEQPFATSSFDVSNVLHDLQRIAGDMEVDANFVRGATQMACFILSH